MAKRNKSSIFLEEKHAEWENYLKENGVLEKYPSEIDSNMAKAYAGLGKTYRYFGNKQKSIWFFKYFTTFRIPDSKFYGVTEEEKQNKDIRRIHDASNYIFRKAIYFNLSDFDPATADKLFGWAAENFVVPQDDYDFWMKHGMYDDIAVAYLWCGYSLLNLGKYEEALELLVQVVPYLDRYKKSGVEMWRVVEYALPKALIPLCEYKLDPTEENLKNAKKGIEDFIKSLRENRHKLEAYLYYFHLKEKFADVYAINTDEQSDDRRISP
ncbi:hypothetical protein [Methanolobus psychrotolerans]|uniref:hypothetical protein n=1 Tax=Methanolobus psychrotolerans TaxID=1874706 RepID=UPI000B91C92C|nr:hypothetical protein [Methanolobus psychrotolerans]